MSKQKKNSIYSLSEIFDYLGLKTDKGKKHQMEKEMQKDPFLADAVEGFSKVDQQRAKEDIENINLKIRNQQKRSSKPLLFAAATVAILIIAGASYIIVQKTFTDQQRILLSKEQTLQEKDSSELYDAVQEINSMKLDNDQDQLAMEESVDQTELVYGKPENDKDKPALSEDPADSDLAVVEDYDIEEDFLIIEAEILAFQESDTPVVVRSEVNTTIAESLQDTSGKSLVAQEYRVAGAAAPVMSAQEPVLDEQIMKGFVIDKTNSEPIAGVTIRLEGTNQVAITGNNGEFSIAQPNNQENTYKAQFVGMRTEEFTPSGLTYQVIAIDQELTSLEEVVVTRQRSNRLLSGNRRDQADAKQSEKQIFKPEPVIGFENYQNYLDENAFLESHVELPQQPVMVRFEVNNQGQPLNIQTISTTNNLLSQKTVNIIAGGPLWTVPDNPSEFNTEPVFMAIVFKHKD